MSDRTRVIRAALFTSGLLVATGLAAKGPVIAAGASVPSTTQTARLVPLKRYWHPGREDNLTAATMEADNAAREAGYGPPDLEGYVFATQAAGTVPLRLFWHAGRGDNFSTATKDGEFAAFFAEYVEARVEGYIFSTQQTGTVPLRTWWHSKRGDNFATASPEGEQAARYAGYELVRIEGYVYPKTWNVPPDRPGDTIRTPPQPTSPPPPPPPPPGNDTGTVGNYDAWSGIWMGDNDRITFTIRISGGKLSGGTTYQYELVYWAGAKGFGSFSNCSVQGNRAACTWTDNYDDTDKTIDVYGTIVLNLSGDRLSVDARITKEPSVTWKPGKAPYPVEYHSMIPKRVGQLTRRR